MSDNDVQEMALSVYKHEMKAGKKMETLFSENDPEVAERAMINALEKVVESTDSTENIEKALVLSQQFAQVTNSANLMDKVQELASEYNIHQGGGANA